MRQFSQLVLVSHIFVKGYFLAEVEYNTCTTEVAEQPPEFQKLLSLWLRSVPAKYPLPHVYIRTFTTDCYHLLIKQNRKALKTPKFLGKF